MKLSTRHLAAAAVLHLGVLVLLMGGMQCSRKVEPTTPIEAVLISADQLPKDGAPTAAATPPPKPEPILEPKPEPLPPPEPEPEPKPLPETPPEPKPKPKVEPEPEPEPPPKPVAKPEPKPEPAPDLIAQEAERAELKRKRDEAEAAKAKALAKEKAERAERAALDRIAEEEEQSRRDQQIRDEALAEEASLMAAKRNEAAAMAAIRARERNAALSAWAAEITRVVKANYQRPASSLEDFSCKVEVTLAPTGAVLAAKVTKSCGSEPLNDALLRAVYRSDPLPTPSDPSVFQRTLTLNFRP